ncbi:Alkaline phosphatase synthesis sensor protein PhoR [Planctomycetes bacterium Poly30]|uniref:histidine kinase n=2 Tax=Saltatorellus ferox TaxID=2528018 RepID=A0A518ER13_9BACT|nr:Alkaline phosphatase synthesis sensor protein PhoR [Planctomycetes bacterium Poly30]
MARRFSSRRTALFLYVVLVGLPAVVFGALLFRQLTRDQQRLLAELPAECEDAAERLGESVAVRVLALLDGEAGRPFWEYRSWYYRNDLGPLQLSPSPLISGDPPPGIVGWFSFSVGARSGMPEIEVLRGDALPGPDPIAQRIRDLVAEVVAAPLIRDSIVAEDELLRAQQEEGYSVLEYPFVRTVVLNLSTGTLDECKAALRDRPGLASEEKEDGRDHHAIYVQPMLLRVIPREDQKYPSIIASRNIAIPKLEDQTQLPSCIDALERTVHLVQGFVIDSEWMFETMPTDVAERVLSLSPELVLADQEIPPNPDVTVAEVKVFERLSYVGHLSSDWPPDILRIKTDASSLRRDFRVQNSWFGGMAFILTISMMIGIRLLLSSIRASRIEAERTRNFVASVTHELRTPIAAVKLYGEMLHDGWVQGEEKRNEYLARIVSESDRLDGLVDRVLLRRKLFDQNHHPVPGDLNEEIRQQQEDLEMVGGRSIGDIRFDLSPGLPHVLVLQDGIHVIVQNLVENARKYAPVSVGAEGPAGEPILVRTRMSEKGHVLLEVLDRGPGIPEKDRTRVFEAFLRLGDESTRSTKGTGLGLHLVALQARAMRGKVRALPREGGGTVFQVQLKRATRA